MCCLGGDMSPHTREYTCTHIGTHILMGTDVYTHTDMQTGRDFLTLDECLF